MAKTAARKAPVKSNKQFLGLLVIVALAGVGTLGYVLTRPAAKALTVDPNIPPGTAEGYLMGKADAPVQVMEFGDFECPGCGQFANVTEPDVRTRLIATGIVGFRFFDFPLTQIHKNTWSAHIAASCAGDQGKFWEMHDRLFDGQGEWNSEATSNPLKLFKGYAVAIGLDAAKFSECLAAQPHAGRIKANAAEGARRQVTGTPTFIIGNKQLPSGPIPGYDLIKQYVDQALTSLADSGKKAGKATPAKAAAKPGP